MTQFVNVNFTGSAGTALSTHDANWVKHTSYSTGSVILSDANRARRNTNNTSMYWYDSAPAGADYKVKAPLFAKEANGGASNTGVCGRVNTAANTMYLGRYGGGTTDAWQVFKIDGGVATQLGSNSSQTLTDETAYDHELWMTGTSIELYKQGSGTPTISVTDSAISAAGYPGFRFVGTTESDTAGLHIGGPFIAEDIGGSYSLAADTGSYSLSGQAAALSASRTITAAQGSYALTGQDANLLRGFPLAAVQGSYLLTGQAATLGLGRAISAAQGAYTLTGQPAALGAARQLTAGQGSYALAGQDASLVYTQAGAYTLTASHGTYALTGQAAGLLATRRAVADQGTYSIAGQAAALSRGLSMAAGQGSYALTGQAAMLLRTWAMAADYGSYGLTGQAVTLTYSSEAAPPVLASLRTGVDGVRRTSDVARASRIARGRSARTNGTTR
jgi:hypothetical protein